MDLEGYRSNLTNMTLKPELVSPSVAAAHIYFKTVNTSKTLQIFSQIEESLPLPTNLTAEYTTHTENVDLEMKTITFFPQLVPTIGDRTVNSSLKDNFLKNIRPLKDPATGKYNKTLLSVTEDPQNAGKTSSAISLSTDTNLNDLFLVYNATDKSTETNFIFLGSDLYPVENETESDEGASTVKIHGTTEELFSESWNFSVSHGAVPTNSETNNGTSGEPMYGTTESMVPMENKSVTTEVTASDGGLSIGDMWNISHLANSTTSSSTVEIRPVTPTGNNSTFVPESANVSVSAIVCPSIFNADGKDNIFSSLWSISSWCGIGMCDTMCYRHKANI